jgi:predicted hydrocarbon binding protein
MEVISIDPHILWDIIITVVIVPAGFLVRSLLAEQKRLDILVNKTREEIAREYVTREQLEKDLEKLISTMERIDEKLDRLQTKTYFQD